MSLGRDLSVGLQGLRRFLLIPGENSGLLQETDTWVSFEGSLVTHCSLLTLPGSWISSPPPPLLLQSFLQLPHQGR